MSARAAAWRCQSGAGPLLGVEQPVEDRGELGRLDRDPAGGARAAQQVVRDAAFEPPVALEVEAGAVPHEGE